MSNKIFDCTSMYAGKNHKNNDKQLQDLGSETKNKQNTAFNTQKSS